MYRLKQTKKRSIWLVFIVEVILLSQVNAQGGFINPDSGPPGTSGMLYSHAAPGHECTMNGVVIGLLDINGNLPFQIPEYSKPNSVISFKCYCTGSELCAPDVFGTFTVTEPDIDQDGIPDYADICPDIAGQVIYNGCPEPTITPSPLDSDQDGIPDEQDQCPLEPGPAINRGCPLPTITPSPTPSPTPDATIPNQITITLAPPPAGQCVVGSSSVISVNIRTDHSTSADITGLLEANKWYAVTGKFETSDEVWYQVDTGWVSSNVTRLGGDCTNLQTVNVMPTISSGSVDLDQTLAACRQLVPIIGQLPNFLQFVYASGSDACTDSQELLNRINLSDPISDLAPNILPYMGSDCPTIASSFINYLDRIGSIDQSAVASINDAIQPENACLFAESILKEKKLPSDFPSEASKISAIIMCNPTITTTRLSAVDLQLNNFDINNELINSLHPCDLISDLTILGSLSSKQQELYTQLHSQCRKEPNEAIGQIVYSSEIKADINAILSDTGLCQDPAGTIRKYGRTQYELRLSVPDSLNECSEYVNLLQNYSPDIQTLVRLLLDDSSNLGGENPCEKLARYLRTGEADDGQNQVDIDPATLDYTLNTILGISTNDLVLDYKLNIADYIIQILRVNRGIASSDILERLTGILIESPIAAFDANVHESTEINNNLSVDVNFVNRSGGGLIRSYQWDFGDGQNSSDQNPTHTFDCTRHLVTLTVTGIRETSTANTELDFSSLPKCNPQLPSVTAEPEPPPTDITPPPMVTANLTPSSPATIKPVVVPANTVSTHEKIASIATEYGLFVSDENIWDTNAVFIGKESENAHSELYMLKQGDIKQLILADPEKKTFPIFGPNKNVISYLSVNSSGNATLMVWNYKKSQSSPSPISFTSQNTQNMSISQSPLTTLRTSEILVTLIDESGIPSVYSLDLRHTSNGFSPEKLIENASSPNTAPNGKFLVFERGNIGARTVHVMNIINRSEIPITPPTELNISECFSPVVGEDSISLFLICVSDGQKSLYRYDAIGLKKIEQQDLNSLNVDNPAPGPGTGYLAFDDGNTIYLGNESGENISVLLRLQGLQATNIRWAPAGK